MTKSPALAPQLQQPLVTSMGLFHGYVEPSGKSGWPSPSRSFKIEARWIINQAEFNGFDHQPVTERFIGRIETALEILIEVYLKDQKVVDDVRFGLDNAKTLGDIRAVIRKVQQAIQPEDRTT